MTRTEGVRTKLTRRAPRCSRGGERLRRARVGLDQREEQLKAGLARFLSAKWRDGASVSEMVHIPGGASRETWRFRATGAGETRGMILRIDPETSLIDTDRRLQYRAYQAAFESGIPAPEPLFLVEDLAWIGRPFSITAEV